MPNYTRPQGTRFVSRGLRTGSPADALSEGQYPLLVNVRGTTKDELTTRAGHVLDFNTGTGQHIRNIVTYPQHLAAVAGSIYLKGTIAPVDTGYGAGIPSMLPLRPAASADAWTYVSDATQYHKLSPPVAGAVTAQLTGIAEPLTPPGLYIEEAETNFVRFNAPWANSGAAGGVSAGTRSGDAVTLVFPDPTSGAAPYTYQVGVFNPLAVYQKEQLLDRGFPPASTDPLGRVNDVFPPLPQGIPILGIEYLTGATGLCVVVPNLLGIGLSPEPSITASEIIANLRRGALVQIGAEVCIVHDVERGPTGGICFTTFTTGAHTTADLLNGIAAIQLFEPSTFGEVMNSEMWHWSTGAGVGAIDINTGTAPELAELFLAFNTQSSFQPDDYLHFSVLMNHPDRLIEMKIIIDVNNGPVTYIDNAFFYTVRPSDIEAGIANTLTQLGVAQLYSQRQLIAEEASAGVAASQQAVPGTNQWSEIRIRIGDFIRIGNDQTRTLANIQGLQILTNTTGNIDMQLSSITTRGQFQMDISKVGAAPILYRYRGRSSVTGAKSNPSPPTRYGVSPLRQHARLVMPGAAPDPQTDLWDIFRIGGTLDTYRLVGTVPVTAPSSQFEDNYGDITIDASEVLEFDNLQPWPTIDDPLNVSSGVSVNGTIVKFALAPGNPQLLTIPNYLPGNLVRIQQTVYTLYTRPTVVGTAVTMALLEDADVQSNTSLVIYEPSLANVPLPFLWGPTAEGGTVFGCGDPYRQGTVYFSKNFDPDSVPDKYNVELSPPTEPLTGGCLLNGESFAFSATKCWALRPSFGGANQYSPREVPTGAGAVSHFAICSDGQRIYFVAKDGIYATSGGIAEPLTTRDNIYSLFPHEGVQGADWTYLGITVHAPNYAQAAEFRLAYANGYLYFDYPAAGAEPIRLVYDIHAKAWYPDSTTEGASVVTMHYGIPQQEPSGTTLVLVGDTTGRVLVEQAGVEDSAGAGQFPIHGRVATRELCPDVRAFSWFGDIGLDLLPTNAAPATLSAQATALGATVGTASTFASPTRLPLAVVDMGGGITAKSLGLYVEWRQFYGAGEPAAAVLYAWNPSFVPKPETTQGRFTDWAPEPGGGNKFFQGFLLEADSGGAIKQFQVRTADSFIVQQGFSASFPIGHQQTQAFSFTRPFVSHAVRLEALDAVPWRIFNLQWVTVPYPEEALTWRTEGTAHGQRGFQHLYMGQLAYIALAPVTLTLRFDQGAPITVTLPATALGLDPIKFQFKLPPNKFKVASYEATSDTAFYLWEEDCEFWLGDWGREAEYRIVRPFGGASKAPRARV